MKYATINPANNQAVKEFPLDAYPALQLSTAAFHEWRKYSVEERGAHLQRMAQLLEQNKKSYAELITLEMGKPLREAEYELSKTLTAFDYYIANAPGFLKNELVKSNASKSYISF